MRKMLFHCLDCGRKRAVHLELAALSTMSEAFGQGSTRGGKPYHGDPEDQVAWCLECLARRGCEAPNRHGR